MRTIDDIPTGTTGFPEAGKHTCQCMKAEFTSSKNKGTSGLELTWQTQGGEYQFKDTLYITGKAISRLACVAKRLCEGTSELELSDDDSEAANALADFIYKGIEGKMATVDIQEYSETFIHESGDKIGQKETKQKKRVGFAGYENIALLEPF